MATIVKHERAQGIRYQVIIRRVQPGGGLLRLKKSFATKSAASAWAARIEGDARTARDLGSPGAVMKLSELAEKYEKEGRKKGFRFEQWVSTDRSVGGLGHLQLRDITPQVVQRELDRYATGETAERKLPTPATVNRALSGLSALFRFAEKKHIWMENPCRKVARGEEPPGRIRWLSAEERETLLTATRGSSWPKLHLLVLVALGTGARASELVEKLSWPAIDWKSRRTVIGKTKNGDPRVLTFPPPLIEALMKFRPEKGSKVEGGLVFGRPGDVAHPYNWRKKWNQAVKRAGLGSFVVRVDPETGKKTKKWEANFRFHDLRHSFASEMANAGTDFYVLQRTLGHKDPKSTSRYAHLNVAIQQKATDRVMGKMLKGEG